MALFSELESSLTLDSSSFRRGLNRATAATATFSSSSEGAFEDVDEQAGAAERSVSSFANAMGDLARGAVSTLVPMQLATNRIDEFGDEAQDASRSAAMASGSFGMLSVSTSGLSASLGTLSTSLTGVAVGLGAVLALLSPLVPALGFAAAAVTGLAGAFGLIIGSGAIAWGEGLTKTLQQTATQIQALVAEFGQQFVPLLKDAVAALPQLVRSLLNAAGNMQPFVSALRDLGSAAMRILPQLVRLFTNVARDALPAMRRLGTFIANNLVPALEAFIAAGRRAAGPITRVATAVYEFGQMIMPVVTFVFRLATSLWNLGAAAAGVGESFRSALANVGQIIRQGLRGAAAWIRSTGIPLLRKAFSYLVRRASQIFTILQNRLPALVRQGILGLVTWVRSTGFPLARRAFLFLARRSVQAFGLLARRLPPLVGQGVRAALTWIRTTGVPLARKALLFLARQATNAFQFGRKNLLPKVRRAMVIAWRWVRTKGVALGKRALIYLGNQVTNALRLGAKLLPRVKSALRTAWRWSRTKGVAIAKRAIRYLARVAAQTLRFFRTRALPVIRSGLQSVWKWLRTKGVTMMKKALRALGRNAIPALKATLDLAMMIRQAVKRGQQWLRTIGVTLWKKAFRALGRNAGPAAIALINFALKALKRGIPKLWDFLNTTGVDIIRKGFKAIGRGIRALILGMFGIAGLVGTAIVQTIKGLRDWLQSGGKKQLKRAFVDIVTGIVSFLRSDGWKYMKSAADFLFSAVIAAAKGLYQGLIGGSIIPEMIADISSAIRNWDLPAVFRNLISDALSAVRRWASDMYHAGAGLVDEIVSGIKSAPDAVQNAVSDVVGKARQFLPFSPAKKGPLSDLDQAGPAFVQTFAAGITGQAGQAQNAARMAAKAARDPLANRPSPDRMPERQRQRRRGRQETDTQAIAQAILQVLGGTQLELDVADEDLVNKAQLKVREGNKRWATRNTGTLYTQ